MVQEDLLLFGKEIDMLKKTGWKYKIKYSKKDVYVVKVNVPKKILEKVNKELKNGKRYKKTN